MMPNRLCFYSLAYIVLVLQFLALSCSVGSTIQRCEKRRSERQSGLAHFISLHLPIFKHLQVNTEVECCRKTIAHTVLLHVWMQGLISAAQIGQEKEEENCWGEGRSDCVNFKNTGWLPLGFHSWQHKNKKPTCLEQFLRFFFFPY